MLNLAWLFGIVFLPVPTAVLVAEKGLAYGGSAFYAATLLLVAVVSLAMTAWILRQPRLWEAGVSREWLRESVWRSGAACVVMAIAVPAGLWLGTWALLLLLLLPASQRVSVRLSHRRS